MMMVGFKITKQLILCHYYCGYMCTTVLLVQFTEEDYRTREGEPAEICVVGIGQIAQPAMVTVSTTKGGTATGRILDRCVFLL